jgi:hypothetical protein
MSATASASAAVSNSDSRERSVDTHIENSGPEEKPSGAVFQTKLADGQLESAIPEDKVEDPIVDAEDGWATDSRKFPGEVQ